MCTIIKQSFNKKRIKTFEVTDYTNLAPLSVAEGGTDGQSGPTTRRAFAKATQVKMNKQNLLKLVKVFNLPVGRSSANHVYSMQPMQVSY